MLQWWRVLSLEVCLHPLRMWVVSKECLALSALEETRSVYLGVHVLSKPLRGSLVLLCVRIVCMKIKSDLRRSHVLVGGYIHRYFPLFSILPVEL
jgi:hypothetical protein